MSFIDQLQANMTRPPSTEFAKIGTLIRKHAITDGLEKTAEVTEKLAHQEMEILTSFYKAAYAQNPGPMTEQTVAQNFANGGQQLLEANNPHDLPQGDAGDSIYKLAAVGVVNHKLQEAIQTPDLTKEARAHIIKLGQENNHHTLALLCQLTKLSGAREFSKGMTGSMGDRGTGIFGAIGDAVSSAGSWLKGAVGGAGGRISASASKASAAGGVPVGEVAASARAASK